MGVVNSVLLLSIITNPCFEKKRCRVLKRVVTAFIFLLQILFFNFIFIFFLNFFFFFDFGLFWFHLVSLGLTWSHLVSLGLTWSHIIRRDIT